MKHIIVAEDDPGIQEMMAIVLESSGYHATVYDNAELLMTGEFEEPDIFFIDRQLQNVDGLDICRHLKKRQHLNTPVIIFSASQGMNETAKNAGADEFLEKPFKIETLIHLIEKFTTTTP